MSFDEYMHYKGAYKPVAKITQSTPSPLVIKIPYAEESEDEEYDETLE
jgi:hypothetical protein